MISARKSPTPSVARSSSSNDPTPQPLQLLERNIFPEGFLSKACMSHPIPPQRTQPAVESSNAATTFSPDPPRSIKCKKECVNFDPLAKKTRGVVTGKMMEDFFRANKGLIKVEYSIFHKGPADERIRSLLTHAIGCCVRVEVPMKAPTYLELKGDDLGLVTTYLRGHFDIAVDDTPLWDFILATTIERFKAWKSECRAHWVKYGDEVPLEFIDRVDGWSWLCNHFNDPENMLLSEKMKKVRKAPKRMNHRSGKTAFSHRAERHQINRHIAPFIGAYDDAYGRDPVGKLFVAQMKEKIQQEVKTRLVEHPEIPPEEPIGTAKQVGFIGETIGECRGTRIRGVGNCMSKEPQHRGGARQSAVVLTLEATVLAQEKELAAQKEEIAAQNDRIARLETLFSGQTSSE